ncbi:zinc ABC transporter substrate-binding protein ZnuA [Nitratireductor pacificus]|uniref:High-affinity zinc uptake system protein ZnuA n=1 Tax=Nitratireductor pacificus pht-3B TaxID=391937 RepID=K2N7D5_9HYPH|nr:zinc ABC transporter substrate-binding protein ZnuA [Nitratireductor pacificus]EKF20033.1 periplasmic solute binding protein [Nitratireductor pacificus pht-3B]
MKSLRSLSLAVSLLALTGAAAGAAEGVVTSIKPVHSLVAAVMEGVGEPELILQGSGSPHTYSMRPSQARMLAGANVVFWVGPGMEVFLAKPLETLAGEARLVTLGETDGLDLLEMREGGAFEAHSHGDEDDHAGEAHGHEEAAHHDHDHGHDHGPDMHLWLDPQNARLMVGPIVEALSEADPENAATYAANAARLGEKLDALQEEVTAELAPVKERPFIVFHDAYQYFERRFGLAAAGSITVSPEVIPGAQRVDEIRTKVKSLDAACVFAEPQFEPRLISVVTEGTDARSGVLDPLGADLADGPELYFDLIRNMATSLKDCLSARG